MWKRSQKKGKNWDKGSSTGKDRVGTGDGRKPGKLDMFHFMQRIFALTYKLHRDPWHGAKRKIQYPSVK